MKTTIRSDTAILYSKSEVCEKGANLLHIDLKITNETLLSSTIYNELSNLMFLKCASGTYLHSFATRLNTSLQVLYPLSYVIFMVHPLM